jgi:hypothetical protein
MTGPVGYEVRVRLQGVLDDASWQATFSGLAVEPAADGTTTVTGELSDEAALHGLLAAVRDLGLTPLYLEAVARQRPKSEQETNT